MADDFIVRLDGFKLTAADKAQIAADIQGSVMKRLGAIDTGGDRLISAPVDPRWKWRGIVAWKNPVNVDLKNLPVGKVTFEG